MSALSFAAALFAALVADLDFSACDPGAIHDWVHPDAAPGFVRTENIYGRRLGDALDVNPRLLYPAYALGRDGRVSAVCTGNALPSIPGSAPDPIVLPDVCTLKPGMVCTQVIWFSVRDPGVQACSVRLAGCQFGYAIGFRLEWHRAHWMPNGGVSFVYGDGKSSKSVGSYGKRDVPPGVWHQVSVVNDGTAFTVYLDGASLGTSPGVYRFDTKRRTPPVKLAEASASACFMVDAYRLYDHALTAAEVAADWAAGQPKPGWDGDVAAAVAALPCVANARQGFFRTGERIDVRSAGKILKSVVYDKPGVEELMVAGRRFPLCIVPARARVVDGLGAVDLVNRQSELLALGIRRTLVKVPWAQIEPARNAYDWTNLDRIDDACAAQGVKAVYLIEGEPGWYAKDRAGQRAQAEKFRRLVAARYEADLVTSADIGFIDLNVGAGQVTRQIEALRRAGKRHLFVKPRPPAWRGRYSAAYAGRPSTSLLELVIPSPDGESGSSSRSPACLAPDRRW